MTRSPALTSSARTEAVKHTQSSAAPAIARAVDINASHLICISWSSSFSARRLLHRGIGCKGVDCRMQRTQNPDNRENQQRERDLDGAVARELAKRMALRLVP